MKKPKFTFIDLFAGIGGFHIAMHYLGGECVFASEWDNDCRKTYTANFKSISPKLFDKEGKPNDLFAGDITKVPPETIPNHDILCGGFPCQPFSQAGYKRGFEDTRGTLFFNVAAILKAKQPIAFFLENVRGLFTHDNGKTFEVIKNTIDELGYDFFYQIVKASDFNCPQHRPRLYMIGIRKDLKLKYSFPKPVQLTKNMSWVFDGATFNKEIGFTLRVGGKTSPIDDRRNWDGYEDDSIGDQDFSLNPGRYVGVVIEDDGLTQDEFKQRMMAYYTALSKLKEEAHGLEKKISNDLVSLFKVETDGDMDE